MMALIFRAVFSMSFALVLILNNPLTIVTVSQSALDSVRNRLPSPCASKVPGSLYGVMSIITDLTILVLQFPVGLRERRPYETNQHTRVVAGRD